MNINIHDTVGFLFDAFCWALGVCFVAYSVITTARDVKRRVMRGIVEEARDIRHQSEIREQFEGLPR